MKKFTVKIRHIEQTRAAQINRAIEGPREGVCAARSLGPTAGAARVQQRVRGGG